MTHTRIPASRSTSPKGAIPDVDTLECDGLPIGFHELTGDTHANFACRWCGKDWATLDAELRATLGVTLTV